MAVIGIVDDEVYYMCSVLSIHCLTKWLLINFLSNGSYANFDDRKFFGDS